MKLVFSVLFCILFSHLLIARHLIPAPSTISTSGKGYYQFHSGNEIRISDSLLLNEARELQSIIRQRTGYSLQVHTGGFKKKAICLSLDPSLQGSESYQLSVTPQYIRISGSTPAGIFYGIQTLDQLLMGDGGSSFHNRLPAIEIKDSPRYAYRALMLDPARHFIPLKEVKRFISLMARYKYNALQLHLTDDQGWRIEIKKYPQLTREGAFRDKNSGNQGPHNGFYTQQELKELIDYAAAKHVEIIPELDIPGHTVAAIKAFPDLGCSHRDTVPILFGQTADRTLCASQEKVYDFYADVLQEVCHLFPSKRIHLGGDEAVIDKNWGHCPECQALMKKPGYRKVSELMGYFFGRIHNLVRQNGKEMMLWCELDNIRMPANEFLFAYPKDCTLFTWRMGLTPKTIELTGKAGIRLVASPGEHCYFDYPQYQGDLPEFNNWGMPLLTLEQAYKWDPGYGLPAEKQQHIQGVAGLLWGEAMQNANRITYMAFPRALALAEAGWSQMKNRSWEQFKENLPPHLSDLMRKGVSFRVPFEIYK